MVAVVVVLLALVTGCAGGDDRGAALVDEVVGDPLATVVPEGTAVHTSSVVGDGSEGWSDAWATRVLRPATGVSALAVVEELSPLAQGAGWEVFPGDRAGNFSGLRTSVEGHQMRLRVNMADGPTGTGADVVVSIEATRTADLDDAG